VQVLAGLFKNYSAILAEKNLMPVVLDILSRQNVNCNPCYCKDLTNFTSYKMDFGTVVAVSNTINCLLSAGEAESVFVFTSFLYFPCRM
jgi:hypothetical protein